MPFVTHAFKCESCGHEEERWVLKREVDAQRCKALVCETHECKGRMRRMPSPTRTTFKFADRKLK